MVSLVDSDISEKIPKSKSNAHSKDEVMKGILTLIRQAEKPPVKAHKPYTGMKL